MKDVIQFVKSTDDGLSFADVKTINRSDIMACKFMIIMPEHYRVDGSCKCNDPEHQQFMIDNWEYSREDFT